MNVTRVHDMVYDLIINKSVVRCCRRLFIHITYGESVATRNGLKTDVVRCNNTFKQTHSFAHRTNNYPTQQFHDEHDR